MKRPRLHLRELFWLVLVVALGLGWWLERERLVWERKESQLKTARAESRTRITWISQRQKRCWIDVGSAGGLKPQTTFYVFDDFSTDGHKARIEVLRVDEPNSAECRVLEDNTSNPILPGDKIFSLDWP